MGETTTARGSFRAPFRYAREANSIEVPVRLEIGRPGRPLACRCRATAAYSVRKSVGHVTKRWNRTARLQARAWTHLCLAPAALCARTAAGAGGVRLSPGSWCIPARLLPVFEDDRTYPFEAHAPFKVWAPLEDAPGSFVWFEPGQRAAADPEQPAGLLVQARRPARRATGWSTSTCARSPSRAAARALLPHDLSARGLYRRCVRRSSRPGGRRRQPAAPLMRRLDYVRAAKTPLRARVPARGEPPGGARAPARPPRPSPTAGLGVRDRAGIPHAPAGCASRSCPTTPSSRSTKAARCCTTRCSSGQPPRASATRCSSMPARSSPATPCDITRTYSRARCGLRARSSTRMDTHAAGAVRRGARRGRLARRAPARP